MSNLVSLTDAKGQTTSFEYDGYSRVKKVIYPGGAYETFTYDAGGRLATKVDRKGVTTTYAYDELSRLTGKTYSDGTTPAVSYTYTTAGQLATAANGTDTLTWTHDLSGQLVSEQSTKNSSTVAYTYDLGGNRLSVSLAGTVFVTYAYDDASRLTTITRGTNNFTFGYDNANRRTSLGYPNGVNTTYTYDTLSRLTNLTAAVSGTTVTSSVYTYDAAGNRLTKTHPDYAESYDYDALYRLTEVNRTGLPKHWIYGYDAVGNRLSEQIDNNVSTYAYNQKNQLLNTTGGGLLRFRGTLNEPGTVTVNGQAAQMLSGNTFEAYVNIPNTPTTVPMVATDTSGNSTTKNYQVTGAGSAATYTYDANGNLTQKVEGTDTWTYEWNAENQLKRVLKNAVEQARFAYDPIGRRVEKVTGGVTTGYTYDGQDILREAGGSATRKYIFGSELDEPLAAEDGGGSLSHHHADGLGSVVRTTNAAGGLISSMRYAPFGGIEAGTAAPYGFAGREWDYEAGLSFNRARYYDPGIGRFIGEDPIGFSGGMNFYAYVDNRPTISTDPSGLSAYLRCDNIDPNNWPGARGLGLKIVQSLRGGTPSRHCFIEVECSGRYRVTMELKGPTGRFPNGFALMRNSGFNPRTSATSSAIDPCRASCPGSCQFEDEIINQFGNESSNRGPYNFATNNSNTFVSNIVRNAGGAASFPSGATAGANTTCPK